ncbi:DUF459 domain-containing protein [Nitrospirillum sp. BR 11828]|uniref:SGNH/GDSL hydrolase family protein n=1 Tax=Nitrospirillum sp. BR 11828 TaxID=3104325 RepID=UPI002ACA55B0|nr:DUF459 domain-containing protein [Nitrospirillum sp. BR 11828]MDZ5650763.1 DUF459 domain-containing protein [Nitrospirillum sp. BR 11828]
MNRRLVIVFGAFFCLSAVASAEPVAPPATLPPPAAPAQTTISVYGDSLADGVWSGLYDRLKSQPQTRLVRHSQLGAGLTRPDYASWQAETARQIDDAGEGGYAIIMFGANDMQGVRDENRKGYLFKSPGWTNVYTQRIDWLLQTLKDHHVTTVWIGLPVMRKPETNEDAKFMTGLYEAEAKKYGAVFLPLYQDYLDADGNFMARIDDSRQKSQQLRSDDGIHFTGYGYQLVASKVLTRLQMASAPVAKLAPKPADAPARPAPAAAPAVTPAVASPAPTTAETPATPPSTTSAAATGATTPVAPPHVTPADLPVNPSSGQTPGAATGAAAGASIGSHGRPLMGPLARQL